MPSSQRQDSDRDAPPDPARPVVVPLDLALRTNDWLAAQQAAFQAAMNGEPLAASLGIMVEAANRAAGDGRRSAFYVADRDGIGLHHVVGMAEGYAAAIDGAPIAPDTPACGGAVATGQPVITRDVEEEPRWRGQIDLARAHGIRGCWSFPIETATGRLVGSFAQYLPRPQMPDARDLAVAAGVCQTAAIILSRYQQNEEHARIEAALRAAEARQAFLLELSDALRPLADGAEIERVAVRLIGERLGADRVFYASVDPDGEHWSFRHAYNTGLPAEPGRFPFAAYQRKRMAQWQAGRMSSVGDCERDPALDAEDRAGYAAFGARAAIGVPLVKDGRFAALLVVNQACPREWSADELSLVREAAERTWEALERARAETALRDSEEKYRTLFDGIDEGLLLLELIDDADGRACDFRYLEINAAFERQAGLGDPVGRLASDVAPHLDAAWYAACDRVRRTGMPERFERYSPLTDRWFTVYATPTGSPGGRRLCVVFADITDRKRAEDAAALLAGVADDLTRLTAPGEIVEAVGARLGAALDVDRCVLVDVDEAEGELAVGHAWERGGQAGPAPRLRFHDLFTADAAGALPCGETLVVHDTASDGRTSPDACARADICAALAVPYHREGRLVAYLAVTDTVPRAWRQDEIAAVEAVAERIFPRIARARAEAALRESEEQQRLLIELVPALLWATDAGGESVTVNGSWCSYTGQSWEETQAFGWLEAIHPDDLDAARAAFAHAYATGEPLERQQRIRDAEGAYRWHLVRHVPVRAENGAITRWFGAAIDIHDLHELQQHQRLLVAELQHRVRNILTVIRLTFVRSMEQGDDLEDMTRHFRGRLDAMARTQVLLSRTPNRSAQLEDLIRDELLSVGATEETGVTLDGPEIALDGKVAESLGMALHELTTNALKYGALGRPGGRLHVRWDIHIGESGRRTLRLVWQEAGVPAVSVHPSREGFGRELIEEALPYRIKAETRLEFKGGGVRCSIAVPLTDGSDGSVAEGDAR